MEGFQLIKQGAEARLYQGIYLERPTVIKERFVKNYRHKQLDDSLTKERIKAETKAIIKCKTLGLSTPMLYLVDFDRRMIFMEYLTHHKVLKDFIEEEKTDIVLILRVSALIGTILGKMHKGNVVHGDLTSSNILLVNKLNRNNFGQFQDLKIVLIDFGLAHCEASVEDKGVDLYVLERALLSTHAEAEEIFAKIMEGYQESYENKEYKDIFNKYSEVRARGRKRAMIG